MKNNAMRVQLYHGTGCGKWGQTPFYALDSVSPSTKHIQTLPANKANPEELAARIKDSVLIVVAE